MSTRIIKINRGDSFEFITTIPNPNNPAENYILSDKDTFYFALCYPNTAFEDAVLLKGCTHTSQDELTGAYDQNRETGEIVLRLTPRETRHLAPGIYYYTAKLYTGGTPGLIGDSCDEPDYVRTIIERAKFIVNE